MFITWFNGVQCMEDAQSINIKLAACLLGVPESVPNENLYTRE